MHDVNQEPVVNLDRLLKLRLIVARCGEMDAAQWWNTRELLGGKGGLLLSRGFPRTHRFTRARIVFGVTRARCEELFDQPGCATLWNLPATVEDDFEARWFRWLEERERWDPFFDLLQAPSTDLLSTLNRFGLLEERHREAVSRMRSSAEGRAVPLPGPVKVTDDVLTLLAAGFSRGQVGSPAIPYVTLEA